LSGPRIVRVEQQPQALAHDFAGAGLKAGVHLARDSRFQFRGKGHIHGDALTRDNMI
jgi:hypothetical protein